MERGGERKKKKKRDKMKQWETEDLRFLKRERKGQGSVYERSVR